MSQFIGVSQRVSVIAEYQERRDTIDQRWSELLTHCNLIPIFLPNHPATTSRILKELTLDGFLLTGGNSLVDLGGDAPERDETERIILEFALEHRKPLLGVCRGMQFIQHYFRVPLAAVAGHVTQSHRIQGANLDRHVNSYHQFGARSTHPDLEITSTADDGVIESIRHRSLPIQGIMWHPERCSEWESVDCKLLADLYAPGLSDSNALSIHL